MKTSDKISAFSAAMGATLKSLAKIAIQSRRCTIAPHAADEGDSIVILANGPSLRTTIARHADELSRRAAMAVNFAANAPEFTILRPGRYVLADPHFFTSDEPNVQELWRNINGATWPLTLYVPCHWATLARSLAPDARVETFNAVGVEGFDFFCHAAFRRGIGMPRPRNVLIAAIMIAIKAGFKTIFLTGADHSWLRTLEVNDSNEVVSVQPHFYADDKRELRRSASEYRGYRLHQILESFTVAFRSYHEIARFAAKEKVKIYNSTPGSFIDAFERREL
ncbi:MAG: hypothetical protein K2L76_03780 [Muribaculaceae bacterium]|nr:hypothetical protein [Muribaculaceae bacterium]